MRFFKFLISAGATALVVACGGGGAVSGGGETPPASTAARIEMTASANALLSATGEVVTVTAVVKNSANNGVNKEAISFSANSGVLQDASTTTDANGVATVKLSAGSDKSLRDITVTARSGSVTQTIVVSVSGTSITISGPSSILYGVSGNYEVSLKDSSGNPVAGVGLKASSSLGNSISLDATATDVNGVVSFKYLAQKSGSDTITVLAVGASVTKSVIVSNVNFAFTSPDPSSNVSVLVNSDKTVTVRYLSAGVGVQGKNVSFSSTRGTVSPASTITDANGYASAVIRSTTSGPATISAQLSDVGAVAEIPVNYFASTAATIVLQANPGSVAPNMAGSTAISSTVTAYVRDFVGNAVQGVDVSFALLQDSSGGSLRTGITATDANGQATTAFIPGPLTTAAQGVVIRATVVGTSISGDALLTVSSRALFITIAKGNTVITRPSDDTVYIRPFSVQVSDASGGVVANQPISLSIYPTRYRKGWLVWGGKSWVINQALEQECPNEDQDRDGILKFPPSKTNLDIDGNGVLTPGLPAAVSPASLVTDSAGRATFELIYGEQYAEWIDFEITARAAVSGTESTSTYFYPAEGLASDYTDESIAPAGSISPFNLRRLHTDGNPLDYRGVRMSTCAGLLQ